MDRYAVIGNPVSHSRSPLIHQAFAMQTGERLRYETLLAPLDGFADAVAAFARAGGRGLNVTVPFKLQAHALADRLSERARAAGAVNTLAFGDNGIFGDNTDGAGLVRDLQINLAFPLEGARVLLLGAGGAARGALLPLIRAKPADIVISNRTASRAGRLAAHFANEAVPVRACPFEALAAHRFDLVINATSTGLSGETLPLPPDIYAPDALAYDMMYGAGPTPFLRAAREHGAARLADGLGMLVEQAAESFEIWRGVRPDTAPVLERLRGNG